ncbi:hypothetical protein PLANTIT3_100065 [Plantibacter sp. T3]|nr:hypothetical protein PLANTIT3_100065 [Plantibacter sp. T3]
MVAPARCADVSAGHTRERYPPETRADVHAPHPRRFGRSRVSAPRRRRVTTSHASAVR